MAAGCFTSSVWCLALRQQRPRARKDMDFGFRFACPSSCRMATTLEFGRVPPDVKRRPPSDLDVCDDAAWLARAMGRMTLGDIPTFREIYRRTSPKLFGICPSILTDRLEAEDALQEIYVLIWRCAALYEETRGAAMSWVIAIARIARSTVCAVLTAFSRRRSSTRIRSQIV
ncbi:hypothetical protein EAH87_16185 [Sphingomonas koreensis]|nr:hypothetical protein EAH87_16185 [Sphingomonas koreensis]